MSDRGGRGTHSRLRAALLACALTGLALPASASAATQTFSFTGGPQEFVVPTGVHQVTIEACGAQGGVGFVGGGAGANGGCVTATIGVTPNEALAVFVGGRGGAGVVGGGGAGGFNGGAAGGPGLPGGGGGGGASDVRRGGSDLADRVVVGGGGGGGGGGVGVGAGAGGAGGGPTAATGGNSPAEGGGGGTQESGGAGAGAGVNAGQSGGFGVGGTGGGLGGASANGGGGGGAGGYHGGGGGVGISGGGGGAGGGGGGSSFPAAATHQQGSRSGDGRVAITYTASPTPSTPPNEPPRITNLRMTPDEFIASGRRTPLKGGTSIRFTLSEPATVHFRVRRDPPRRRGGPPPKHSHRFTRELEAGKQRVPFTGTLDGRTFKPRDYLMFARAVDAAGLRSAAESAPFSIVRR